MDTNYKRIGVIAGSGVYPKMLAESARAAGVEHIAAAAFKGETEETLEPLVDRMEWLRVGQLGKMIKFFRKEEIEHVMMAGQIAPDNLFDLRPDMRALIMIGKLKERNAESLFGAIADELEKDGIEMLLATTFVEDCLASAGHVAGPEISEKRLSDVEFGVRIAKEVSRLDIGQTVVVKKGTVLAVEAFEGTNEAIARGGRLGKGGATMVKVSKPNQDFRFDVPVVGRKTIDTAEEAGIDLIVVEAGRTLILDEGDLGPRCDEAGISIFGEETS